MDSEIHIAEYIKKGDKNLVYSEITFIFSRKYYNIYIHPNFIKLLFNESNTKKI